MNRKINTVLLSALVGYLAVGCASTQVALSKKDLDVQNKMSATLFLDPIDDQKLKTVFIQAKNTSDYENLDLGSTLRQSLTNKGFKVVPRLQDAHYVIQLNVLQVGKMDPSAAEASVYRGYGADGVAIGAGVGYVAGGSAKVSGGTYSRYTEKNQWKIQQTRVLSSANKVNLKLEEALPQLQTSLARAITGIF